MLLWRREMADRGALMRRSALHLKRIHRICFEGCSSDRQFGSRAGVVRRDGLDRPWSENGRSRVCLGRVRFVAALAGFGVR
jgi:hypothetical protein